VGDVPALLVVAAVLAALVPREAQDARAASDRDARLVA
jgi:hypothetical protein